MPYLKQRINGETVSVYELGDQVILGRHVECHITVDDPTVSAKHAELVREGGRYHLRDLDSTNGVRLGGSPIKQGVLADRDIFSIGTHQFEFLEQLPTDLDKTSKIKKSWIPGIYYTDR